MRILQNSGENDTAIGKLNAPITQYLLKQDSKARKESPMPLIFPSNKSNHWAEGYGGRTSLNSLFQSGGENELYPESKTQDDYTKTIENTYDWRNSFSVSKRMQQDKQFDIADSGILVDSYYTTMEKYGAAFLANAYGTTFTFNGKTYTIKYGDDLALFSTAHTSKTGIQGTQSNLYNVPFTDENLAIMEGVMKGMKDSNGDLLGLQPDTIIIPAITKYDVLQKKRVFEALGADGDPESTDRRGVYNAGRFKVICWDYLEAPSDLTSYTSFWYLMDSKFVAKAKPYVHQIRSELEITHYIDNKTKAFVWDADSREVIEPGATGFQGIIMCGQGLSGTDPS